MFCLDLCQEIIIVRSASNPSSNNSLWDPLSTIPSSVKTKIESAFIIVEIIEKTLDNSLKKDDIKWSSDYSLSLILVSDGYPLKYEKNKEISGLEDVKNSIIFHNGTKLEDGKILTNGGRVLTINAKAKTLELARKIAYDDCEKIKYENKYYRKDIGLN